VISSAMGKRPAEDEAVEAPAKKKGGYKCPITKVDFLRKAQSCVFKLDMNPKEFSSGSVGWHCFQRIKAGNLDILTQVNCTANVFGSKDDSCGLPKEKFMKEATILKFELEGLPYEFSTGSFGWAMNQKRSETVDGVLLTLQVNLNAVVQGAKPDESHEEAHEQDPDLAKIDKNVIAHHLDTIGRAKAGDKDDLKKIKGVGPFIERRLNHIGIQTFNQIEKMTPTIEDDVNAAIIYFPGRVRRDEWMDQAKEFAKKKK